MIELWRIPLVFNIKLIIKTYLVNRWLNNRMVSEVAITVFCLKVVRYSMYMWLPMYLLQQVRLTFKFCRIKIFI